MQNLIRRSDGTVYDANTGQTLSASDPRVAAANAWYGGTDVDSVEGQILDDLNGAAGRTDEYDAGPGGGDVGGGEPGQLVPVAVRLSALLERLGPWVWGLVTGAARGAQLYWAQIPRWGQLALEAAGVAVGSTIIVDTLQNQGGVGDVNPFDNLPSLPEFSMGGDGKLRTNIVKTWQANGATFYMLSDGRIAVRKKNGRWRVYRPARPIVMTAAGPANRRIFRRAAKALQKDVRESASILRGFGYEVARRKATYCGGCGKAKCVCKR